MRKLFLTILFISSLLTFSGLAQIISRSELANQLANSQSDNLKQFNFAETPAFSGNKFDGDFDLSHILNRQQGRLYWIGMVDDEVHLIIHGNTVLVKTISGTENIDWVYSFTSPFPEESVQVFVDKKDGRGNAKVIQLPTADNDWTAIIQILDKNGGARDYDLEIYWKK